jgi:hypothetical protein
MSNHYFKRTALAAAITGMMSQGVGAATGFDLTPDEQLASRIAGVTVNTVNPIASGTGVVGTNKDGKIWYSPDLQA